MLHFFSWHFRKGISNHRSREFLGHYTHLQTVTLWRGIPERGERTKHHSCAHALNNYFISDEFCCRDTGSGHSSFCLHMQCHYGQWQMHQEDYNTEDERCACVWRGGFCSAGVKLIAFALQSLAWWDLYHIPVQTFWG